MIHRDDTGQRPRSRTLLLALVVLALGVAAAVPAAASPAPASPSDAELAQKPRCKVVKKKVRGTTRNVRVCTKATAKARNVGMTLDPARTARQEIALSGGTVATATADGARLSLAVPGNALLGRTGITITPVRSVAVPKGVRLLAAAQLGPEGLGLARPATLTIELPAGVPARNVHAFGWFGVGRNVHRLPVRVSGNRAEIRLTHFSGAGIAVGSPGWAASTETALTIQFGRSVRPQMRAAETNDALIESAFGNAFGWLRAVELLGLGDRFKTWRAEIFASFRKALQNAMNKATERCVEGHDLSQLERMPKIGRAAELMGIKLAGDPPLVRVEKCARFELDFETVNRVDAGAGIMQDNHVRVRGLKLRLSSDLATTTGEQSLDYVSSRHSSCGPGTATVTEPVRVASLSIQRPKQGEQGAPEVTLLMTPGSATVSIVCGDMTFPAVTYVPVFWHMHQDERSGDGFAIRDWAYEGGAVVARKRYDRSKPIEGGGTFSEQTTFVLRHTPAR